MNWGFRWYRSTIAKNNYLVEAVEGVDLSIKLEMLAKLKIVNLILVVINLLNLKLKLREVSQILSYRR